MPIHSRRATPLFQVFHMRRSVAWYRDMLGFELVNPTSRTAFVLGDASARSAMLGALKLFARRSPTQRSPAVAAASSGPQATVLRS
jgi:hypothetical protein